MCWHFKHLLLLVILRERHTQSCYNFCQSVVTVFRYVLKFSSDLFWRMIVIFSWTRCTHTCKHDQPHKMLEKVIKRNRCSLRLRVTNVSSCNKHNCRHCNIKFYRYICDCHHHSWSGYRLLYCYFFIHFYIYLYYYDNEMKWPCLVFSFFYMYTRFDFYNMT